MKYITAKTDYGEKETYDKWNGKFYSESELNEIVTPIEENTAVLRPNSTLDGSGVPIAYVILNAFPNDTVRNILY